MSDSSSPNSHASHDSETGGSAHTTVPFFGPSTTSRPTSFQIRPPRAPTGRHYSDAETGHFPGPSRRRSASQTVSEFLHDHELAAARVEANDLRRQNIMAMDRKRRLTTSTHDGGRRRTTNGSYHDRSPGSHSVRMEEESSSSSRQTDSQSSIIDLTASTPTHPAASMPPPNTRHTSLTSFQHYVKPRWQPDAEVSECPICHRPFTWMFRRHHCRKCGRVVCNDCSPHRITIPRQFIVNPVAPATPAPPAGSFSRPLEIIDLTADNDQLGQDVSSNLSGGEKVRLCNPCVPDPQPDPLSVYPASTEAGARAQLASNGASTPSAQEIAAARCLVRMEVEQERMRQHRARDPGTQPTIHAAQYPRVQPPERSTDLLPPYPSSEHASMAHAGRWSSQLGVHSRRFEPGSLPPEYNALSLRSTFGNTSSGHGPHTSLTGPSRAGLSMSGHGYHQSLDQSGRPPTVPGSRPRIGSMFEDRSAGPRSLDMPPAHRTTSVHHRARVHERDVCPICRRLLPPKGPNGEETAREAHIIDCISSRDPSSPRLSRATGPAFSPDPIRILPFVATEKDCVSEDGTLQECSICMVEYDVGDALARLECLCKFHKECIVGWFERKQECPLHKIA